MKFRGKRWLLGFYTLLISFHCLWAMDNVLVYNKATTEELKKYIGNLDRHDVANNPEVSHRIRTLIEQGADPSITQEKYSGWSPIHLAAKGGQCDLIKFILAQGVNIEITNNTDNQTALHQAARRGFQDAISLLISSGANIEAKDIYGNTPLFYAIQNRHKNAFRLLLSLGANIKVQNKWRSTPLREAASYLGADDVGLLISLGADIEATDSGNNTPLRKAFYWGKPESALLLIAFGATIPEKPAAFHGSYNEMIFNLYFSTDKIYGEHWLYGQVRLKEGHERIDASADEIKAIINRPGPCKNTPLDLALITRNASVIPRLLALGADPWSGLFDGVFLASRIPEFKERKDGQPSIYEQNLYVPLKLCWLIKQILEEALYNDILNQIVKLNIRCRKKELVNVHFGHEDF